MRRFSVARDMFMAAVEAAPFLNGYFYHIHADILSQRRHIKLSAYGYALKARLPNTFMEKKNPLVTVSILGCEDYVRDILAELEDGRMNQ